MQFDFRILGGTQLEKKSVINLLFRFFKTFRVAPPTDDLATAQSHNKLARSDGGN